MRAIPCLFGLFAAAGVLAGAARADILVAPLRTVISESAPVARYRVSNASDRIVEARIGWIDLSATPVGYEPAPAVERAKLSAAPFLVVTPARLRLEPGAHGDVVVRVKKGASIPAGERRSHLLIETAPARTPLRRASAGLEVDVGLGVSTPVILRGGYAAPSLTFEQSRLVRDGDGLIALETTLRSEGDYSAYGRIEATLEAGGRATVLSEMGNVAVYPDAGARKVTLPFALEALPPGRLTIAYRTADQRPRTLVSKTFDIAPPALPRVAEKNVSGSR